MLTRTQLTVILNGLPTRAKNLVAHWENGDERNVKAKIADIREILDKVEERIKDDLYRNL
jgi:hypothetical protein